MHYTLEGITESPPNFIYPKRGKGKHRENPRGKKKHIETGKGIDYARGMYYHPSHPWHSMGTVLNDLAWMGVVIFMHMQNRKGVRKRVLEEDCDLHAYVFSWCNEKVRAS